MNNEPDAHLGRMTRCQKNNVKSILLDYFVVFYTVFWIMRADNEYCEHQHKALGLTFGEWLLVDMIYRIVVCLLLFANKKIMSIAFAGREVFEQTDHIVGIITKEVLSSIIGYGIPFMLLFSVVMNRHCSSTGIWSLAAINSIVFVVQFSLMYLCNRIADVVELRLVQGTTLYDHHIQKIKDN